MGLKYNKEPYVFVSGSKGLPGGPRFENTVKSRFSRVAKHKS
jgi:hypothetical protein